MHYLNNAIPSAEFKHSCSLPGIPTEAAINTIGILMSTYGIKHQIPVDPNMECSYVVSGPDGDRINNNNMATVFELKSLLEGYSRDFTNTVAELQVYNGLYMIHFKCW